MKKYLVAVVIVINDKNKTRLQTCEKQVLLCSDPSTGAYIEINDIEPLKVTKIMLGVDKKLMHVECEAKFSKSKQTEAFALHKNLIKLGFSNKPTKKP